MGPIPQGTPFSLGGPVRAPRISKIIAGRITVLSPVDFLKGALGTWMGPPIQPAACARGGTPPWVAWSTFCARATVAPRSTPHAPASRARARARDERRRYTGATRKVGVFPLASAPGGIASRVLGQLPFVHGAAKLMDHPPMRAKVPAQLRAPAVEAGDHRGYRARLAFYGPRPGGKPAVKPTALRERTVTTQAYPRPAGLAGGPAVRAAQWA